MHCFTNHATVGRYKDVDVLNGYILIYNIPVTDQEFKMIYPSLRVITGYLQISYNSVLTTLTAFQNVTTITGSLQIYSNSVLTTLTAFQNLTTIGNGLYIDSNSALTSISTFQNLVSVGGSYIEIRYNPVLSSISDFKSLVTLNGYLYLSDNAPLSNIDIFKNLVCVKELGCCGYLYPDTRYLNDCSSAMLTRLSTKVQAGGCQGNEYTAFYELF